jgi:ribosomal protein S20
LIYARKSTNLILWRQKRNKVEKILKTLIKRFKSEIAQENDLVKPIFIPSIQVMQEYK